MRFKKIVLIIELLVISLTLSACVSTSSSLSLVSASISAPGVEVREVVEEQVEEEVDTNGRIFYFERVFTKTQKKAYIIKTTQLKDTPSNDGKNVAKVVKYDEVLLTGYNDFDYWRVEYNNQVLYIEKTNITTDYNDIIKMHNATYSSWWTGPVLTPRLGTVTGPTGRETYYNLNMNGVIAIMRRMGYDGKYWVREDGVKMLGDYIMCAANLNLFPRGSLVESSLGTCIVCDTGGFALVNPYQLDIAVIW